MTHHDDELPTRLLTTHRLAHADGIRQATPPGRVIVKRPEVLGEAAVVLDQQRSVQRSELVGVQRSFE